MFYYYHSLPLKTVFVFEDCLLVLTNVVCLCAAVSQPKRNFNTMRSPKDLTSESSISRSALLRHITNSPALFAVRLSWTFWQEETFKRKAKWNCVFTFLSKVQISPAKQAGLDLLNPALPPPRLLQAALLLLVSVDAARWDAVLTTPFLFSLLLHHQISLSAVLTLHLLLLLSPTFAVVSQTSRGDPVPLLS